MKSELNALGSDLVGDPLLEYACGDEGLIALLLLGSCTDEIEICGIEGIYTSVNVYLVNRVFLCKPCGLGGSLGVRPPDRIT